MPYRGYNLHRQTGSRSRHTDPRRLRARMVSEQLAARGISNPLVLGAMGQVPRHLFVQEALAAHAYEDTFLPIGYGQTISSPYMVARMCELLEPAKGLRVLEIGAGCGYQMAVLSAMGCTVYGIERVREIYQATFRRLKHLGLTHTHLYCGDGTLGMLPAAPFDRIIVAAGGPEIPPPLVRQLGEEGIMVIPVGGTPRRQRLLRVLKSRGRISTEDCGPAIFVDLIGDHGWQP